MLIIPVLLSINTNAQSTGNNTYVGGDYLGYNTTTNNLNFGFGAGPTTYMTLTPAGSLGLGITAPGSLFQINGNAAIGYSATTAAPANGLLVSGTVGIGTTSPTCALSVTTGSTNGGINVTQTTKRFSALQLFNTSTGGRNFALVSTGYQNSEGAGNFGIYDYTAGTYRMFITSAGRIGIGTLTPIASLDVAGTGYIHVAGNTSPTVTSQGAYLNWDALTTGTGETDFINNQGTGTGGFAFMNTPSSGTPITTLMFLTGAGNLGIGTTSPNNLLQVANLINFDNTNGNTWLGYQNGISNTGYSNTGMGYNALYSNTSGNNNTAIGMNAMYWNTSGYYNTAIGSNALFHNTNSNGIANTATGFQACGGNTTGSFNTSSGAEALASNSTGSDNTAVGGDALMDNNGSGNTALGANSLEWSTSSTGNTAVGQSALYNNGYNTTGNYNTALGYYAGELRLSNNENTFLGAYADAGSSGLTNATAIGYDAIVPSSDEIFLGNSFVSVITGNVMYTFSDERFKTNVTENVKGLAFINKLRPVTYNMDTKVTDDFLIQNMPDSAKIKHQAGIDFSPSTAIVHSGFIAQEVDAAAQACGFTSSIVHKPANSNDPYALSYAEIVVPLVKAVQELSKTIDSLKTTDSLAAIKANKQAAIINGLLNHQQTTDSLLTVLQNCCTTGVTHKNTQNDGSQQQYNSESTIQVELANNSQPILYQNEPNPFGENTVIRYFIPTDNKGNVYIIFYDMYGKELNKTVITTTGFGTVNANAENLANGIYSYSLVVNDNVIDTKKMVKTK